MQHLGNLAYRDYLKCRVCLKEQSFWRYAPYWNHKKLTLFQWMYILYAWCMQVKHKDIYVRLNGVLDEKLIGTVMRSFERLCLIYESNNILKLGGIAHDSRKVVYSDHTHVRTLKYNRGYGKDNNACILGNCEEGTGLFTLDKVANERMPQTDYMLRRRTHEYTDHVTDEGGAFNNVRNLSQHRTHETCNHSGTFNKETGKIHHFVDQNTGQCTNPIEGVFGRLKQNIIRNPTKVRSEEHLMNFAAAYQLRHNHTCNLAPQIFVAMLYTRSWVYPLNGCARDRYTYV